MRNRSDDEHKYHQETSSSSHFIQVWMSAYWKLSCYVCAWNLTEKNECWQLLFNLVSARIMDTVELLCWVTLRYQDFSPQFKADFIFQVYIWLLLLWLLCVLLLVRSSILVFSYIVTHTWFDSLPRHSRWWFMATRKGAYCVTRLSRALSEAGALSMCRCVIFKIDFLTARNYQKVPAWESGAFSFRMN